VKLRAALLVLVFVVVFGVGTSQATVSNVSLTLSTSSAYAVVSGTTVYYNGSQSGDFTVTATGDSTHDPGGITSVIFPDVFDTVGHDGATDASSPFTNAYSWTSSATASGAKTVTVTDADNSVDSDFTVTPDTAPTITNAAPNEVSGAGDQFWTASANTLWFRPAGAGSFTLNATADDPESGIAQVAFPDVSATTGWSGSTGGTDPAADFASPVAYTWAAGASTPGAKQVTATNGTGMTASATVTISADSTAPTGQTVTLSGGPWYPTTSVPLTIGQGSDSGAGVDSKRGVVERASAPLSNGVCGTFGAFATVTLAGGADTTVATANCYRYQYKATDNVGNVSTASAPSADAKVDTTPPTVPTLIFTGLINAASVGNVVYYRPASGGAFTVSAAAADGESGIAAYAFPPVPGFTMTGTGSRRTFTFGSSTIASSTPFSVTATNGAGLTSTGASFMLVPDSAKPTITVRCNGKPCYSAAYPKGVTVTVKASDGGGSGVSTIRYTTNGKNPTPDDGVEYFHGFTLRKLTHLRVRAYDRAGNPSQTAIITVRSEAERLVFGAPPRLKVTSKARFMFARVTSTRRAIVTASMTGPGLGAAHRWQFVLTQGTSVVQIRLPAGLVTPGRYRVVWSVQAGSQKTTKTTWVSIRRA
jgi:hypothetical protein